jgi:GH25 family lysozyme M1 (1,4-beta-N-acetylmuramidase)
VTVYLERSEKRRMLQERSSAFQQRLAFFSPSPMARLGMEAITFDPADPTRVLGIDLHQWSGDKVDWVKMKDAGIKFVLIKCKHGLRTEWNFHTLWDGAAKAGLLRGAWSWLYPSSVISAGTQARSTHTELAADPGEIKPFVDFEWTSFAGRPANPGTGDLWGWVKPYEDEFGIRPGIYTSYGFWNEVAANAPASVWGAYDLWVANYKTLAPTLPRAWTTWKFWQWTEAGDGVKYGVDPYSERAVDLNYWNGTVEDLLKYAGKEPPPVEPPVEDDPIVSITVKFKSGKEVTR